MLEQSLYSGFVEDKVGVNAIEPHFVTCAKGSLEAGCCTCASTHELEIVRPEAMIRCTVDDFLYRREFSFLDKLDSKASGSEKE